MDELIQALKSETLDERHAAVAAMAEKAKADPASITQIINALKAADMNTRWYLGRALVKIGRPVIPVIIDAAESESDMGVQKYFGAVLAAFGEAAVPPLIALFSSANPAARGMAGAALEKIGQPALDPLLEAAQSDNQTVKICAGLVLMKLGVYEY